MGDHVIDTNVLLVASAQHPGSPFDDSNVPAEQKQNVLNWLVEFGKDAKRYIVLDLAFEIWGEYCHQLTGQDFGLLVVMEKLQSSLVRFVEVEYDRHGHGRLPAKITKVVHDRSDRKFVTVHRFRESDTLSRSM